MIIRGTIKRKHISNGRRGYQKGGALNLSLEEKGFTNVIVTSQVVKVFHKDRGEDFMGVLPNDISNWLDEFHAAGPVEPIRYRLELE